MGHNGRESLGSVHRQEAYSTKRVGLNKLHPSSSRVGHNNIDSGVLSLSMDIVAIHLRGQKAHESPSE